jgi:hypothetical protein
MLHKHWKGPAIMEGPVLSFLEGQLAAPLPVALGGHQFWSCASTSVPCAITGRASLPRHHIAAQILKFS